jgi:hypothetical protein
MQRLRTLAVILVAAIFAWVAAPVLTVSGGQTSSPGAPGQQGEQHPVIRGAIKDLERAKGSLEKRAAHDFGGHRIKAIAAIDEALQELTRALEFEPKP